MLQAYWLKTDRKITCEAEPANINPECGPGMRMTFAEDGYPPFTFLIPKVLFDILWEPIPSTSCRHFVCTDLTFRGQRIFLESTENPKLDAHYAKKFAEYVREKENVVVGRDLYEQLS